MLRFAIGSVVAAGFSIGMFALGVAINDRAPPLRIDSAIAVDKSVPQGGSIGVEFKVYRERRCKGFAQRWLYDAAGTKHSIPQFTAGNPMPPLGPDVYKRTITIPDIAAIGPAYYQVEFDYYCNLFHWLRFPIHITSPKVDFDITPNAGLVPFGAPPAATDG